MASFTRRVLLSAGVGLGVLYVGWQLFEQLHNGSALRAQTEANAIPDVAVVNPKPGPKQLSLVLPGTIDAWYQAPIYPQATGYVKMWYKDYGAEVKAGDVLAEINTPSLDAEYQQAKAAFEATKAKYNLSVVSAQRWRAMSKSQAVSGQSVSVADANEKSGEAEMNAALHNVARYEALERFKVIVAPFDGVVTARDINVGDFVSSGGGERGNSGEASQLFVVSDVHKLRLFVSVPEAFSYVLKPGMTADVTVPQFPHEVFKAQFLTVAKGYDPNTRTAVTEFTIDNDDHRLWPGTFASVRITAPADDHVYELPTATLVFQEPGMQVAIVDDKNRVHFQNIKVGRMADTSTTVSDGVKLTDKVIKNPPADLLEGQQVNVVQPAKGYENADEPEGVSE